MLITIIDQFLKLIVVFWIQDTITKFEKNNISEIKHIFSYCKILTYKTLKKKKWKYLERCNLFVIRQCDSSKAKLRKYDKLFKRHETKEGEKKYIGD